MTKEFVIKDRDGIVIGTFMDSSKDAKQALLTLTVNKFISLNDGTVLNTHNLPRKFSINEVLKGETNGET